MGDSYEEMEGTNVHMSFENTIEVVQILMEKLPCTAVAC